MLQINDVLQTLQEPHVNLGQLLDTLYAITLFQSLCNSKDAEVGGVSQCVVQVVELGMVVAHEAVHALTNHAQTLLNHFLETSSDRHDFAYRLHGRANQAAYTRKLRQVPTGNLTNHIVQLWSYVGRRGRTHLTNLVERVSQCNLRGYEGERITRCLRG